MRRRRGFTLIEMAVTVAVVAVLAAIAAPVVQLSAQRAREAELRTALRQIREAIDTYKRYSDEGRIAKVVDASGYPPALEDLVKGVPDAKSPKGARLYILRRIPRDPLNPDLSLAADETWGLRSYASPPDEPAEGADVFDVYSRATGKGLNGIAYREW
ncbi:MAG TPA: type II secretion system protein [Zoogloea sp.]|uniref:type II secretion system protein n=1 Tax=Zoogloea sp. TaxID=49181 RepID=UPI002C56DEE5|nr:type II secretion system protein [Zoogloea sp.]HMV19570.1 type II secretion system protein [Rhodocyclaceae bacterium]HMV64797.1 type II secretion system protein [Rhodocyclaceae bacterium]HMZ75260.1 type II secretion system protein [Rhodocyclaceae bacterium]HNA66452.1 type II secretion system protein [Rhodocyclaceae bacterium]HNB64998.1 type II secretion system protein [Rhodocyclaceae bacterium]